MGAYLSKPVTEKHSSDDNGTQVSYGASYMQGWRVSQEDAHNAILDYDTNTHLFAVYDGHGGHEVSTYTALELPEVIKATDTYTRGSITQSLTDSFLKFDATLVQPEVVSVLTHIASSKESAEESDDSEEDVDDLYREATMPLAEVIAKYAENPQVARCKDKKAASPYLKAKHGGEGSSSSGKEEEEEEEEKEEEEETKAGSSSSSSTVNGAKEEEEEEEEEKKKEEVDSKTEINGDKHMLNGGKIENGKKTENKEEEEEEEEEEKETQKAKKKKKEEEKEEKEEEDVTMNGETKPKKEEEEEEEEVQPRKGKGKGKGGGGGGGKGKALVRNSEVVALRERRAKEKRREAAVKAAEIYRRMQEGEGKGEEEDDDDDDDDDDEEEDENFEEGGDEDAEEDGDAEESEEEEEEEEEDDDDDDDDDDEDEDGVETEEDEDDPYTQFALNMKEEPGFDSGCTACVALIRGTELYVANVGDSRCVVCEEGKAVDMSLDHKPEDDPEATRIRNAGGRVTADGRVNGGLNLSRAIGDHGYKQNKTLPPKDQMISPHPDVRSMTLSPKHKFIIVACDGIWNSLSSQEACDFVAQRMDKMEEDEPLSSICEELFDHCLAPDTHGDGTGCDNMTCIIISLNALVPISTKRPLEEEEEEEEGAKGEEKKKKKELKEEEKKEGGEEKKKKEEVEKPRQEGKKLKISE